MNLIVRERLDDSILPLLEVGFSVAGVEREVLEWLGPARAVDNITKGTGLIMCNPLRHDPDTIEEELMKLIPLGYPTGDPYKVFRARDIEVSIFRGDTPTALIVACGCWLPLFLTESNCVRCAIHTGLRNSWKNFAVVCSEKSSMQVSIMVFSWQASARNAC